MVMIKKEAREKLRKDLPRGSARKIKERLFLKHGDIHDYCIAYINQVLDPDFDRQNDTIIDEAVCLRDETNKKRLEIESRILS